MPITMPASPLLAMKGRAAIRPRRKPAAVHGGDGGFGVIMVMTIRMGAPRMSRDPLRALSQFFGGRVCLDFANTVEWRLSAQPQEPIPDYRTLLRWSELRAMLPGAAIT